MPVELIVEPETCRIYPNELDLPAFDPLHPGFLADPYPFYRRYRANCPVHCSVEPTSSNPGFWYLFRYADVAAALKDPRFGREMPPVSASNGCPIKPAATNLFYEMAGKWMLYRDPPDHTRLRSLVNKAFTPRMVEQLRPQIAILANSLLDEVEGAGAMDVIADYAFPLPLATIAALLGVRAEDQRQFREWSNALSAAIDQNRTPNVYEQASQATVELSAYFRAILSLRREQPEDDLMSALIYAEECGGHLSEDEVVGTCILLLAAGHETTVDLVGNSMLRLLRNPTQLNILQANPALLPAAVEELMRFDSPVQMTARIALEDVEIDGHLIRKGAKITMVLGSANRDPEAFENPEELDLRRGAKTHLCFGLGIHFCTGAPLARAGGQIGIGTLLRRFPGMRLDSELADWRDGLVFRGLRQLPVSF